MNKNHTNGAAKGPPARAQQQAQNTSASPRQEARRLSKPDQDRLDKACGDVREALKNSRHT
jgi:hypothetical protein